jgi:hypothetical protein
MVRLGKDLRWTLVLAAGLLIPARAMPAQTATATPQVVSQPNRAAAKPANSPSSKAGTRSRKSAAPVAAVPQVPVPPATLEQTPTTPPLITYQNGQLSIDARNSTLSQVLRAVQVQTGASMEMPASAGNERVVTQLGPGQPKDVLNSLLNGTKFDYIILGVTGNPGAVQRIILTPRQNSGANVNVAQNNNPGQNQQQMVEDESPPDEGVPVTNEAEAENPVPEPQSPPPPGGFRRPMMQPPGQPDQSQGGNNGEPPNGAKTPEQLMQEMQQMQQQQQQYQQQLNPANQQNPQ